MHLNKNSLVRVFRSIYKIFAVVIPIGPLLFTTTLIINILLAIVPLLQLYITKLLVDHVTLIITKGEAFLPHGIELLLLQTLLLMIGSLLNQIASLVRFRWLQKVNYHFERLVSEKSIKVPLLTYESPKFYDQLHRASSGLGIRSVNLIEHNFSIFKNGITLLGYALILLAMHWTLFMAMIIFVVPTLLIHWKIGGTTFMQMKYQTPTSRRVQYLQHVLRSKEAAKEIRIFEHGDFLLSLWKNSFWINLQEQFSLEKKFVRARFGAETVSIMGNSLIVGILLWVGARGHLTIGSYVSLYQAVTTSQSLLHQTSIYMGLIYEDALLMEEVFLLLKDEDEVIEQSQMNKQIQFNNKIEVNHLTFQYPGQQSPTLKDISFTIQKGEKVAIVGDNGAGKSTLVKCLIGLYPIEQGSIYLDELKIEGHLAFLWRKQVSAIFQDFLKYHLSVRDNIGLSSPELLHDDERIRAAAETAGATELINELPEQYHTQLGTAFTGGIELSGGQWQKIALSRAFLRNSDFIVLDEPTASLDPIAEVELLENFMKLMEDKTAIIVTHRLGCCINADKILVLRDGYLIEQGNHHQLIEKQGEYAHMFQAQAQWYTTIE